MDDFSAFADLAPADSRPLYGVRLFVYLDKDGVENHQWSAEGEPHFATALGAVESMKLRMFAQQFELLPEEPD